MRQPQFCQRKHSLTFDLYLEKARMILAFSCGTNKAWNIHVCGGFSEFGGGG